MSGGYRRDALDFAEHVLIAGGPADPVARRELTYWWRDRSGSRPPGRATPADPCGARRPRGEVNAVNALALLPNIRRCACSAPPPRPPRRPPRPRRAGRGRRARRVGNRASCSVRGVLGFIASCGAMTPERAVVRRGSGAPGAGHGIGWRPGDRARGGRRWPGSAGWGRSRRCLGAYLPVSMVRLRERGASVVPHGRRARRRRRGPADHGCLAARRRGAGCWARAGDRALAVVRCGEPRAASPGLERGACGRYRAPGTRATALCEYVRNAQVSRRWRRHGEQRRGVHLARRGAGRGAVRPCWSSGPGARLLFERGRRAHQSRQRLAGPRRGAGRAAGGGCRVRPGGGGRGDPVPGGVGAAEAAARLVAGDRAGRGDARGRRGREPVRGRASAPVPADRRGAGAERGLRSEPRPNAVSLD
ncbi:hypothetical protein SCALM49S_02398 [Streptomyces californicus]